MGIRVGIFSTAHPHAWSYASCLKHSDKAELVGVWDDDEPRLKDFCVATGALPHSSFDALKDSVRAAVITSENAHHAKHAAQLLEAGVAVLCEKPLATTEADAQRMVDAAKASGAILMTAFPCRFSPSYQRLKSRVHAGDVGPVRAICATNRGTAPIGSPWFMDRALAGGAAMIDHTVHVADLLFDLLGAEPVEVHAQIGHGMYGKDWEDTAILTLEYPGGVFATLDSSWSVPQGYPKWGDVTMNVVGDAGVIEMDMFAQDVYVNAAGPEQQGFGSNLDELMIGSFLNAVAEGKPAPVTGEDGLRAVRVAMKAYASLA